MLTLSTLPPINLELSLSFGAKELLYYQGYTHYAAADLVGRYCQPLPWLSRRLFCGPLALGAACSVGRSLWGPLVLGAARSGGRLFWGPLVPLTGVGNWQISLRRANRAAC